MVFPVLSATRENITALGIYEARSIIYWSDNHSNSIFMLQLNDSGQTQPRPFIKLGLSNLITSNIRLEASNCYGLAVDNALGQVYYSGWNEDRAWIKVASWDGEIRRTVISSANNPLVRKPRDLVYDDGKLYWLDDNMIFRAAADGRKIMEIKPKTPTTSRMTTSNMTDSNTIVSNMTDPRTNAQSLSIDGKGRLVWTQPHLNVTRLFDLESMTIHTLRFENGPMNTSLVLVDSFSGELIFYEPTSGNLTGRYTDEFNGTVRLKNSTRLLRSGVQNLISMKLLERDPLAEHGILDEQEQCKKLGCHHFCLQSFNERRCACADGFESLDAGKCQLPKERVMLLDADHEFFWSSNSSMINIPVNSNSSSLIFQPRYFALNDPKQKVS